MPLVDDIAGLRRILTRSQTIAVVGLSANWYRPSYFAAKYMRDHGYRIVPVNPNYGEVMGERCYPDLISARQGGANAIDIVDCFRKPSELVPIARDAIAIGAKVLWMQLGIRNEEAAQLASAAGLDVVMDRCVKIEHARILGGLNWAGVNTRIVSATTTGVAPMADRDYGFDTLCLHAGQIPDRATGARALPIYQTTSFVFDSADHAASLFNLQTFGNVYSRISNPTVCALEERVAALEGGRAALAAATGMAAQTVALLTLAKRGDHIVAARTLYGGTYSQFAVTFAEFGIDTTFADPDDPDSFRRALKPNTKAALRRDDGQPAAQRHRPRRAGRHRARRGRAAGDRQHACLAVSVPADRARRRHRHSFRHQVSWRPRHDDGRSDRRVGQV